MSLKPSNPAALILARMDSSRFPGKATTPLAGKELIRWCIDGVRQAPSFEPIILTSNRPVDDPLEAVAQKEGVRCFRGELENVAKRIFDCITSWDIDIFARVNGDSPFVRADLLEEGLALLNASVKLDFVTNLLPRRFPYGLSVEVFRSAVFQKYYPALNTPDYREHVTTYFYDHLSDFRVGRLPYPYGNDHDVRLTVDTPADKVALESVILRHKAIDLHALPLDRLVQLFKGK